MKLNRYCQSTLPHDLFHSHIIPDLLSEHLHLLLVSEEPPEWHSFYTLPLVSFAFRDTCQLLYMAIFGLERNTASGKISSLLDFAQSHWQRARSPPESIQPLPYTYTELMSNKSLIGVYTSLAIARTFLNIDVLWPLACQEASVDAGGISEDEHLAVADPYSATRPCRMQDEKMHTVYMPLTCATKLCDFITPERVAYKVAGYIAEVIPTYSTIPVMLKCSQDLKGYVIRKNREQKTIYVEWAFQTLGLIERCKDLLVEMQTVGCLVNSFTRNSLIPDEVVQSSKVAKALRVVIDADWGKDSEEVRGRASALLQQWTHIQ